MAAYLVENQLRNVTFKVLVLALQQIGFPHLPDLLAVAVVDQAETEVECIGEKLVEIFLRQFTLDKFGRLAIDLNHQILQLKLMHQIVLDAHYKGHGIVGRVLKDFHLQSELN